METTQNPNGWRLRGNSSQNSETKTRTERWTRRRPETGSYPVTTTMLRPRPSISYMSQTQTKYVKQCRNGSAKHEYNCWNDLAFVLKMKFHLWFQQSLKRHSVLTKSTYVIKHKKKILTVWLLLFHRTAVWRRKRLSISTIYSSAARRPTSGRLWLDTTSSNTQLPPQTVCSSCVFTTPMTPSTQRWSGMSSPNPTPRTIIYLIFWMCLIMHTLTFYTYKLGQCVALSWFAWLCSFFVETWRVIDLRFYLLDLQFSTTRLSIFTNHQSLSLKSAEEFIFSNYYLA